MCRARNSAAVCPGSKVHLAIAETSLEKMFRYLGANIIGFAYIRTGSGSDRVVAIKDFIGENVISYEARPGRYRSRF